jgi:hypothetical protein
VLDVVRLTLAEQRLQERIGQDAGVEGRLEAVDRLLATCVLVQRRHLRRKLASPATTL